MQYIFWNETNVCLKDYTLILPSISVGNVGQLAVDLLLNNLGAKSVAYFHHPCFLPIIGPDPIDSGNDKLATSCQLYECREQKLAIIQLRSLFNPNQINGFGGLITNFIREHEIKRTIMLCTSFSEYFTIDDIQGIKLHYLCSEYSEEEFKELSWKKFSLPEHVYVHEKNPIPGGGIAKYFLDDCKSQRIPLVVLILVCSEGNNYPEAHIMVEQLSKWLQLKPANYKWIEPGSWALPYGRAAPRVLY